VATLLESPDPPPRGEVWGPRVPESRREDGTAESEPHGFWVRRSELQHSDTLPPAATVGSVVMEVLVTWEEETRFVSLEA